MYRRLMMVVVVPSVGIGLAVAARLDCTARGTQKFDSRRNGVSLMSLSPPYLSEHGVRGDCSVIGFQTNSAYSFLFHHRHSVQ